MKALIRRQWNDYREAAVQLDAIGGLHWSRMSGGVHSLAPQAFIHGYVSCDNIEGEIAHSCQHGSGPHTIKVVLVRKSQSKDIWDTLIGIVGKKPNL